MEVQVTDPLCVCSGCRYCLESDGHCCCHSAQYVVTFDLRSTAGLRRMSLAEARSVLALADRIPKRGFILEVQS